MTDYKEKRIARIAEDVADLGPEAVDQLKDKLIYKGALEAARKVGESDLVSLLEFGDAGNKMLQNWGKMQGISSGYPSVDRLTKGFVGGELTIVAGQTSYGKTALCLNIANNVALTGKTILFVSMEMSGAQINARYQKINGGMTDAYFTVAANTVLQKKDELNWKSIDALIGNAKEEMGVELVVIDHLHYFTRELEHASEDIGRIVKEIKKNCLRHNIPVLLISHIRKTNGQEATLEDLRGSSFIGQDADIVLMVGRDKEDMDSLFVKIEKNRNRGYDFAHNIAELEISETVITEKQEEAPGVTPWND
jgi:replicative DNA helicase